MPTSKGEHIEYREDENASYYYYAGDFLAILFFDSDKFLITDKFSKLAKERIYTAMVKDREDYINEYK